MVNFKTQQLPGAPTVVIDGVVGGIEEDFDRQYNKETEKWESGPRKGRVLGIQTAGADANRVPELEAVKVPLAFDDLDFQVGQRVLINVEVFHWANLTRTGEAKGGGSFRFVSLVDPGQFDAWKGVVGNQRQAATA